RGGPMSTCDRRQFLHRSAADLAAASAARTLLAQDAPVKAPASERLRVGCVGVGGRGGALLHGFASLKDVEIVRICDVDSRRLGGAAAAVEKRAGKKPAV